MITKNIKKIIIVGMVSCVVGAATTSCSDMLESDSSRQLFDPALDQKTDSVFYAYGIMQAMQQLADQYYFQNEMRGDLVRPTAKASTHLRNLASFTADATNKYDSVYLYYKVINNCNYYLAHRDTTLATGSHNVVSNEYAAVASFRAWTYLQLTRQYGAVPYVTEPVTTIGQINANTSMTAYETILAGEADMLESLKARYTDEQIAVPNFNQTSRSIGTLNWKNQQGRNEEKYIHPGRCCVPLNVVLGDIYLELGQYERAAKCYYDYLRYEGQKSSSYISVQGAIPMNSAYSIYSPIFKSFTEWPADYDASKNSSIYSGSSNWITSFQHSAWNGEVLSYIPMAVNYTMGKTTDVPAAFGYNYYGTESTSDVSTGVSFAFDCPKTEDIQVVPSQAYCDSARRSQYYYYTEQVKVAPFNWIVKNAPLGDARAFLVAQGSGADSSYVYVHKPSTAYILLYRNSAVWLHLAEAINRMGYPDAAFAVLKNGLQTELVNYRYEEVYLKDAEGNDSLDADGNKVLDMTQSHIDDKYYLTPESYELLTTRLPFLAQENSDVFKNGTAKTFVGIHFHGAGAVEDLYSTYRYDPVVRAKIDDVYAKFNLGTPAYDKDDYINAVEDLLCDEYAMEFAFEGTRFSDLRRLAIHKNQSGIYGGGFGNTWLSRKLENNAPGITTQNCYLPYK
ncbi:MAG: RagB/SusD family nutrient uptake outer membrane protein [Prevotella sp.]|nr:RagB/SusD family nutrient uptake outer membrane protein [Prevotella sp.]